jgi:hypothetical protein
MSNANGFGLFVIGVAFFLGWYAVGTQLNVRRGNAILKWLQDGLTLIGEKTTMRWLGSSAVELKVQNAKAPFRQVELFVVLEPRDGPLLWWFFRARGRRDFLIVRGHLNEMPEIEAEAIDPKAWSTRGVVQEMAIKRWKPAPVAEGSSLVAYSEADAAPPATTAELVRLSERPGYPLLRLAVRHAVPNLELQWRLADFKQLPSTELVSALQSVGAHLCKSKPER